jgi:hypothetical protein
VGVPPVSLRKKLTRTSLYIAEDFQIPSFFVEKMTVYLDYKTTAYEDIELYPEKSG